MGRVVVTDEVVDALDWGSPASDGMPRGAPRPAWLGSGVVQRLKPMVLL
jgi:hypothetical protein